MRATMSALQPAISLACDQLRVVISRHPEDRRTFEVRVQQRGTGSVQGWLDMNNIGRIGYVQQIRRSYERQLTMMRGLALAGVHVPPLDETALLDLGRQIAAVLPEVARQMIVDAAHRARRRRRMFRLLLEVTGDAGDLLAIPWELMVLPSVWGAHEHGDTFFFLRADRSLVRQIQGLGQASSLSLSRPLQLQAFAATPQHTSPVATHTTQAALQEVSSGMETYDWYSGCNTLAALQERLREANPQVVHLLCHGEQGDIGRSAPRYSLLFTHADGCALRVRACDIARALTLAPNLRLVVLQACHAGSTAATYAEDDYTRCQSVDSIAVELIRSGIPAVVAMQGEVGQSTAREFVRACYAILTRDGSLDRAVAAGRLAMRAADGVVDWSLPVIYRGSDLPISDPWYARVVNHLEKLLVRSQPGRTYASK